ncbi:MAG: hypothetical protein AMXMBFR58_13010 [Phycisphaerae bacterium]
MSLNDRARHYVLELASEDPTDVLDIVHFFKNRNPALSTDECIRAAQALVRSLHSAGLIEFFEDDWTITAVGNRKLTPIVGHKISFYMTNMSFWTPRDQALVVRLAISCTEAGKREVFGELQ